MQELIEAIKKFCLENYDKGYDVWVECYSDEDLEEYCTEYKVTTLEEFIASTKDVRDHREEQRQDAINSQF